MPVGAFSADGRRCLRRAGDRGFEVLDLACGETVSWLKMEVPSFAYVDRVVLNHDGSLALFGISDATGALLRVSDGRQLFRWSLPGAAPASHMTYARAVNFSADGRLAALGTQGHCLVFETESGRLVRSFDLIDGGHFYPRTLAGRLARKLRGAHGDDDRWGQRAADALWLPRGERAVMFGVVSHLCFSPCGQYLAGAEHLRFSVWSLTTGRRVYDYPQDPKEGVMISLEQGGGVFSVGGHLFPHKFDGRSHVSLIPQVLPVPGVITGAWIPEGRYRGVGFWQAKPPYRRLAHIEVEAPNDRAIAAGVVGDEGLMLTSFGKLERSRLISPGCDER